MFQRAMLLIAIGTLFSLGASPVTVAQVASVAGQTTNVRIVEEDSRSIVIEIALDLTLKNDSKSRVILYLHNFEIVEDVLFRRNGMQNKEVLYRDSNSSSIDRSPVWAHLQKRLDLKVPPVDMTRTLRTGESIHFKRTRQLRFYKKERIALSSLAEILETTPVWLTVNVRMFPNNLDRTSVSHKSFGLKLQKKWKRFGVLQLGNLRSEPIKLDLGNLSLNRACNTENPSSTPVRPPSSTD